MRHVLPPMLLLGLFCQTGLGFDGERPQKDGRAQKIELPDDPKTPVLMMDYKGGFTPPRKKDDPALTILADGTVLMPDRFGLSRDVTGKISRKDPARIKQKIAQKRKQQGGLAVAVADAATTWVKVRSQDETHEAQYYALGMAAKQHPEIAELQRLAAVADRLRNLMHVVRGGGEKRVRAMLKQANQALEKQFPAARAFTLKDLSSTVVRPDGSVRYTFQWSTPPIPGMPKSGQYANARVQVPPKGQPEVAVRAKVE